VTRPFFSGPKTKTRIRYRLDGYQGDITVGGREYIDGVVLADQRKPDRARCVTSFPYDLDRDETGNWLGRLRGRLQIGMLCWLLVMIGWAGGSFVLHQRYQAFLTSRPAATSDPHREVTGPTGSTQTPTGPGEAVMINGAGETRTIDCAGNDVIVNGSENRVDIRGHCRSLTVSGSGSQVGIDVADTITANGMDNVVTFRAGEPQITTGGVANTVLPG
jgi:Protein of unknown function (DUF3060)